MSQKLRDYQVLDVLCGGTFYKVRHKVTNEIFAWKAYDCSVLDDNQIKDIVEDTKILRGVQCDSLVRYYDTILHAPSRTLYVVVEHDEWSALGPDSGGGGLDERGVWRLVLGLARALTQLARLPLRALRPCLRASAVFIDASGAPHADCLDLNISAAEHCPPLRQLGLLLRDLCYAHERCLYSDDVADIISFLIDDKNADMKPTVLLYHPTVLANLESSTPSQCLNASVISSDYIQLSDINKCDSQKAVELCTVIESASGINSLVMDSPIYSNVKPKKAITQGLGENDVSGGGLSPTIAALALELPGFVPRSRRPMAQCPTADGPQRISEQTLSQQWMTRLIALRQREESLNKRERNLISKEIVHSPATKLVQMNDSIDILDESVNGITLPAVICGRPRRRPRSLRPRRASQGRTRRDSRYEDLDSSLSADPGDSSLVVTATKLTHDNMPRRNIFPELSTKKVHFTPANPFAESDDSITLTYYELDVESQRRAVDADAITKFRYLDIENAVLEKRAAGKQWHSSPNKQAKVGKALADVTNTGRSLRRTPSKTSIASKSSSASSASTGRNGNTRLSLAPPTTATVPRAQIHKSPKTRRSLLPFNSFKTPFKFMSSTKS